MSNIAATLTAQSITFSVRSRSAGTGQRLSLSGTIHATAGSVLELYGDLGSGGFVKLQDITADAAAVISGWTAEKFRIQGTGSFSFYSGVTLSSEPEIEDVI